MPARAARPGSGWSLCRPRRSTRDRPATLPLPVVNIAAVAGHSGVPPCTVTIPVLSQVTGGQSGARSNRRPSPFRSDIAPVRPGWNLVTSTYAG
jgi:hypothetical protein